MSDRDFFTFFIFSNFSVFDFSSRSTQTVAISRKVLLDFTTTLIASASIFTHSQTGVFGSISYAGLSWDTAIHSTIREGVYFEVR